MNGVSLVTSTPRMAMDPINTSLERARRADATASPGVALAGPRIVRLRADVNSGCNAVPHVAAHECAQGGRPGARPARRAVGALSAQSRGPSCDQQYRRERAECDDGRSATRSVAADQQSSNRQGFGMTNVTVTDHDARFGHVDQQVARRRGRRPVGMGASVQPAGAVLGLGGLAPAGRSQEPSRRSNLLLHLRHAESPVAADARRIRHGRGAQLFLTRKDARHAGRPA